MKHKRFIDFFEDSTPYYFQKKYNEEKESIRCILIKKYDQLCKDGLYFESFSDWIDFSKSIIMEVTNDSDFLWTKKLALILVKNYTE